MERSGGYSLRALGGCLVIILLMTVCGGVTVFTLDRLCFSTLSQRLPIYPDGEVRAERHNLLTSRGMGETYIELYSSNPPTEVREWYARATAGITRRAALENDFVYRLARSQWNVVRAEDGEGSVVQLLGSCAQ